MRNVFIDFEASQYTQEIISVGAVADTGEEFYSLVNTKHTIGRFVSELTGINQKDIYKAKTADCVFDDLYSWLYDLTDDSSKIQFICYGNCDMSFAINTLKSLKWSMCAQMVLSLIICNMVDYSEYVKSYFGLSRHIGLLKVAQYYSNNYDLVQTHNALDDAKMLKFIYENVQKGEPMVDNPFEEYMQRIELYDNDGNLIETFYGMAQAVKWISEINKMPAGSHRNRIVNKILAASQQKKSYCGFNWVVSN